MLNISQLPCAELLCTVLPESFSQTEGQPVVWLETAQPGVRCERNESGYQVESSDISLTLVGLGQILAGNDQYHNCDTLGFRGLMLDASRNGVPHVAFLKQAMVKLALMGMNHFCLYTEDTFTVEGEPLIGFGRGAYSKEEIRELVAHSSRLGITMFPCFQTLGHLEQILKYQKFETYHDNHRVLNVRLEETYTFVEQLIDSIREPYDTNLIHLGMDEPWGIGRGKSFDSDNPCDPGTLYVQHVARVAEICEKKGLQGIIWGDYVLGHPDEKTASDNALDTKQLQGLPENMIMDYWNYFDTDEQPYLRDIKAFQDMGYEVLSSPGLQTWNNFWGQLSLCQDVTAPFIKACRDLKTDRAMITVWGDDGHECLFDNNWAALSHFFAQTLGDQDDSWQNVLRAVTGSEFNNWRLTADIEESTITPVAQTAFTPTAKMLFYDDPIYGYVSLLVKDNSVAEYYSELSEKLRWLKSGDENENERCKSASLFCSIIADKFSLIHDIRSAYAEQDKAELMKCYERAGYLIKTINQFKELYRRRWMNERKPFGFEVVDIRFGGMCARLDSLRELLADYCCGSLKAVAEFDYGTCEELTYKDLQFYPKIKTRCFSIW